MFCFGMIPKINTPMRASRKTASAIDHIITNSIMHTGFKSGFIKTGISDHFHCFCCKYITKKEDAKKRNLYINADSPISQ